MKGNYGFIHEKLEIKILILFILRRLAEPVSLETLTELTMSDDGIGYFDYVECVADLVRTEHISYNNGKYAITEKGMRNGEITESSLPFTVRRYTENAVYLLNLKENRHTMIKTAHTTKPEGGCTVTLSLSDGIGVVFAMELYAADEQHALALEDGFRKQAENVHNMIIKTLLT